MVARLGTENRSTATPNRVTDASGSGASGSFLPPWFLSAPRNQTARLRRVGATPPSGKKVPDGFVDEMPVRLDTEDRVGQLSLATTLRCDID
jgi:hypothetical protein